MSPRDRRAYAVCAACHGTGAEGNQSLNAPKLAGQPGWYLTRQLRNYKHGIREARLGTNLRAQMKTIATLLDATTIDNVVAYIATLPDKRAHATVRGDAARGRVPLHDLRLLPWGRGPGNRGRRMPRDLRA